LVPGLDRFEVSSQGTLADLGARFP
jgi:hypothetical protein